MLRKVTATRYVTPLREGGSLPAIMEADDGFLYVVKFRGAGQGARALVAELIGGEIARLLGLRVPELVFVHLDESFGRIEGDEEIQDLLKASTGLNLGVHYLTGAITYDPVVTAIDPLLASKILWLDLLLLNVDRTTRNTNMLWWKKGLWLIDHGAALYFHHNWDEIRGREHEYKSYPQLAKHVLLPFATKLVEAEELCHGLLNAEKIASIVNLIPEEWLQDAGFDSIENHKKAYIHFLMARLQHSGKFIEDARQAARLI